MVFPDPYPGPPTHHASSPLPDAPKADDSRARWDPQPDPVDGSKFDLESLDALLREAGMLPDLTPESQLGGEPDIDWTIIAAGDTIGNSATDVAPAAPAPPPPLDSNSQYFLDDFLLDIPEWDSSSLTPPLTDVSSVTSPPSDSAGGPSPTYKVAPYFVSSPDLPFSGSDFTGGFQQEQGPSAPLSWCMGDNTNFAGQIQPDYAPISDFAGMHGNTLYLSLFDHTESNLNMATPIRVSTATASTTTEEAGTPGTVLGKRTWESSETSEREGASGVLEAAGSAKRTRRTPATKTQLGINDKSKAVGRGAGRLTSTTANGVYHRSLLGPNVPQGSVGALAQGQPSWTEERVQEETWCDTSSTLSQRNDPQISKMAENREGFHTIPKTLTARQRLLLQTTQVDAECGAISVIRCRLCPTEQFKTWPSFYRHCRDCEEHPAKINCCEWCGIYFGRQDSKKRHIESATKACCETTPAEAAWRKHKAEQLLADFQARVEYCLMTGEELGLKFAAIARAELPSKSKKIKSEGNNSQVVGF